MQGRSCLLRDRAHDRPYHIESAPALFAPGLVASGIIPAMSPSVPAGIKFPDGFLSSATWRGDSLSL